MDILKENLCDRKQSSFYKLRFIFALYLLPKVKVFKSTGKREDSNNLEFE